MVFWVAALLFNIYISGGAPQLNDARTEASAGGDRDGMPDFDERAILALARTGLLKQARAHAAPSSSGFF